MAEKKNNALPSAHPKGGAGVYAKQFQRKLSRAQEKVLQKFGKSDETRDEKFEAYVECLQAQQSDGHKIYKDLKAYLNAVKVMRDASSRLFQSLFDAYELDWEGGEDLGAVVEGEDLLWNDYETKLRDQLFTMESYMSQFPDIRERVAKRNRKLVDYDSSRHQLKSLQNSKKKDDIKISKAEEEMKSSKQIFENMNQELKEELPVLYNSRVGCYVTIFQAISDLRDIFYKEMAKNNQDLQNIMSNLRTQHPDKNFVIKNFNRTGSLKRRSLKEALSPRSLRSSFLDFHTSYSPRGTLRRENRSSFRSDRSADEFYSPELSTSPGRLNPSEVTDPRTDSGDPSSSSGETPEGAVRPSTAMVPDDVEASRRSCSPSKEDSDPEDGGRETGESERLLDGSPSEGSFENDPEPSNNYSSKVSPDASSAPDAPEDSTGRPDQANENGPSEKENGIGPERKAETTEEPGTSHKHTATNDVSGKVMEETDGQII